MPLEIIQTFSTCQKDFLAATQDPTNEIVVLLGGRRTGKTTAGCAALGIFIYTSGRATGGVSWVVSYNGPQSVAAQTEFVKIFGFVGEGGCIKEHLKASNAYVVKRAGGHGPEWHCRDKKCKGCYKVEFKSAVEPDTLRGRGVDSVLFDEAALMSEYAWTTTLPVIGTSGGPIWCTTTPDGLNWFYDSVYVPSLGDKKDSFKFFHGTPMDNPAMKGKALELLKAQYGGIQYEQEIMGLFKARQGLIYPFDEEKHTLSTEQCDNLPDGELIAGVDFGFSQKEPFCYLWVKKIKKAAFYDNRALHGYVYVVLKELYESGKGIDELVPIIKRCPLERSVYGRYADPSRNDSRDYMMRMGCPTWLGKNDWTFGYSTVASYVEKGDLYISKDCPNGIREMSNYIWDEKKSRPKAHQADHFCDALRYVIASEETLNIGEPCGYSIAQDDGRVLVVDAQGNETTQMSDNVSPFTREERIQIALMEKQRDAIMKANEEAARAIEKSREQWVSQDDEEFQTPETDRWGQPL